MFSRGLKRSTTPSAAAVPGMSCMSPPAPLGDTAAGSKPDSVRITAVISPGLTPCSRAISWISAAYRGNDRAGRRSQPVAVPVAPGRPR